MDGRWVVVAAINGLLAVVAGAFGAHALREHLTERSMATFETAARYQMYHALALLAVAALLANSQSRSARVAGIFMLAGIALFSGSLYGLARVPHSSRSEGWGTDLVCRSVPHPFLQKGWGTRCR